MKPRTIFSGALAAGATLLFAAGGFADSSPDPLLAGRAQVYENLDPTSLEAVPTPERVKAVTEGNAAPMEIWSVLESAEGLECLDCIPMVAPLLYADNARTREISAWWLRRRIFGVFTPSADGGPSIYDRVIETLATGSSARRRAYAAEALGEFLTRAGIGPLSRAVLEDPSPVVRDAAVRGLERLNSEGADGEMARAMSDRDEGVRLQALRSAIRINVFTGVDSVVARIDDESPLVRRRAAEALGAMRAVDAVVGLIPLTDPSVEADPQVRKAAVFALGRIADPAGKEAVEAALEDPDYLVRDAAKVARRRL